MHIKVMTRKTPGITITHPRPRKLNVDSMVIQLLIEEITTNMIAETKFGIRW